MGDLAPGGPSAGSTLLALQSSQLIFRNWILVGLVWVVVVEGRTAASVTGPGRRVNVATRR